MCKLRAPLLILAVSVLACAGLFPAASESAAHGTYAGFAEPVASYRLSAGDMGFASESSSSQMGIELDDYAIYRYGYVSYDGEDWERFELSGSPLGGEWLNGSVSAQLSMVPARFNLSQSRLSARRNFVVVYSCSRASGTWDCHGGWQIWQFNATLDIVPGSARIVAVEASEDDGHVAENTLDGDFSAESRWSGDGDGQWIRYELNETVTISFVRLAAYSGDQRLAYFSVAVSADGSSWQTVLDNVSTSGGTLGFQQFSFTPVQARYVRFTGHGNTESTWNSYTEVSIQDFPSDVGPPPCVDEGLSVTCSGKCGQQQNNCGKAVDCGGCAPPDGATYAVIGDSMSNNVVVPATMGDWPGWFITKLGVPESDFGLYAVAGHTCAQVYNQLVVNVSQGTTYLFSTCGINGFSGIDNTYWYQMIYTKAKEKGVSQIYMTTMPPYNGFNSYDQETADERCDKMKSENEWLKDFASQHADLHVVDLWTLWHDTSGTAKTDCGWRTDQSLTNDGIHPNDATSGVWAQEYYDMFTGGGTSDGAVVVYQNNFEQRPLGPYASLSDFMSDWSSAGGGNRWDKLDVVSGIIGNPTKVLEISYPFYDVEDFRWICWSDTRCDDGSGGRIEFTSPPSFGNVEALKGVGPASGGGQWEVRLPAGPDHGGYKELYLSYKVKFGDGFFAVDGGKLPGLCGTDGTAGCPGGGTNTLNSDGDAFRFSARMMFEYNNPKFYMYYPDRNGDATDTGSGAGPVLSADYKDGQWHTFVQRIVMNDLNSYNGVVEAWIDGVKVAQGSGYRFRMGSSTLFALNRILFSTFFGGDSRLCTDSQVAAGTRGCAKYSDGSNYLWYAPRKTEHIYFDNIVVYYYDASSDVPLGNVLSPADRVEWPPSV